MSKIYITSEWYSVQLHYAESLNNNFTILRH